MAHPEEISADHFHLFMTEEDINELPNPELITSLINVLSTAGVRCASAVPAVLVTLKAHNKYQFRSLLSSWFILCAKIFKLISLRNMENINNLEPEISSRIAVTCL